MAKLDTRVVSVSVAPVSGLVFLLPNHLRAASSSYLWHARRARCRKVCGSRVAVANAEHRLGHDVLRDRAEKLLRRLVLLARPLVPRLPACARVRVAAGAVAAGAVAAGAGRRGRVGWRRLALASSVLPSCLATRGSVRTSWKMPPGDTKSLTSSSDISSRSACSISIASSSAECCDAHGASAFTSAASREQCRSHGAGQCGEAVVGAEWQEGGGGVRQQHLVEGDGPVLLARAEQAAEAVEGAREARAHPAVQRLEARAVSGELDLE
eukprot:scaffold54291_cov69-Phaeocystis_antarctica.AAC.2